MKGIPMTTRSQRSHVPEHVPSNSPTEWIQSFKDLIDVMAFLRSEQGCDWDKAQTLQSLRPYLLEEAHEVLDILDQHYDASSHCAELGDLLLQIVFQAQIQREADVFHIGNVCDAITQKLVRRHPELFDLTHDGPKQTWEEIKEQERQTNPEQRQGLFDSIPKAFPALLRAYRMGEKAHEVGFDWPDTVGVIEKIEEELGEVKEAISEENQEHATEEIGDLLYAVVNLSRHLNIDPESALRGTMKKFQRRFHEVEKSLWAENKSPQDMSLEALEERWEKAKHQLKKEAL